MFKGLFLIRSKKRFNALFLLMAMLVSFIPIFPTNVQAATTLKTYPAPSGTTLSTDFTVKVRVPGGTWQDLDEYQTRIGAPNRATFASFVYFDTDGPVDLSVTYNAGTVTTATVKPNNLGITPAISGNTMTFSISGPQKLVFDVNGNVDNDLMIFANPVEVNPPSPTDPNVIYLGPGVYNQTYNLSSGQTLYIAGGAVVRGGVNLNNATNAKVIGRGVIESSPDAAVYLSFANNVTLDGVILNRFNAGIQIGNSTNVTVNNVKLMAYLKWTDGIDNFCSTNVSINDVFVRSGDDSIAVYASRFGYSGNSSNISVTNSILMPGKAHPINIGTHGNPGAEGGGDNIDTLNFSNLDILTYNTAAAGLPLAISFTASDGSLISDANFTDIRIDDAVVNKFIDVITFKNPGYGLAVGRGINNVYFKNISYNGTNTNANQIYGTSSTQLTQNVTFENLTVNGTPVLSASAGNITIGNYANNINFITSGGTPPSTTPIPHYTPINLALNRTASADSSQAGNPASSGNDSNDTTTRWSANDGNTGHSWTVDLGSSKNITHGTQVKWQNAGGGYQYKIETSNDNTNWKLKVDKTSNTSTDQVQSDVFYDTARYVRITVTGLPSGANASFYDFKVFGDQANLALNKTASSDSSQSSNPASFGADGNAATRWIANDANTGHSLTVDLGASMNITNGTQVAWEKSGVYQYKIEKSTDNTNWTTVIDKTANSSTDQVQNDYFTGIARYVRITVTGLPSGANASIYDFKIFGDPTNLALNKASSSDSSQTTNPASNGNDGNMTTNWTANDGSTGHWWMVDLGTTMNITNGIQVMWQQPSSIYLYKIETSTDNINWTTVIDRTVNLSNAQVYNQYFTGTARYVRVTSTGLPSGANASINEFKVFGFPNTYVNDTDSNIVYNGSWSYSGGRSLGDHQDDVHYTTTNNASAEYTFTGRGVDYITEKNSDQGQVDIYIDGVYQTTVDCSSSTRLAQQLVYSITGLASGTHTIKVVKKTGTYMLVDAFNPNNNIFDPNAYYTFKNHTDGLAMSGGGGSNGSNVTETSNTTSTNSQWQITDLGNGYFKIKNRTDGLVLNGGGGTNGSNVTEWSDITSNNLQWQITDLGNGYYKIKNHTDGKVLNGGSGTEGSNVTEWSDITSNNLQWQISKAN
ncbi:discoidin domain-containing protein [Paenibacillus andongensis]|uniref:discoidin domain-containing protein n=1 Tax=Paenibacillus andongensis TaxID=2975482 RepID=UPI0021BB42A2|nr:discoidin domain-containing protein [Paenibacillus andongensis]